MTDETQEAEELLQQSSEQTLHDHDTTGSTTDDTPSLEDAVAKAYAAIDDDDANANEHLATRDRNLSALFMGLDNAGQLAPLGNQAADALGRDADPETQAEVIRLLLRYAIDDLEDDDDGTSLLESGKKGLAAYKQIRAKKEAKQASESDF